MAQLSSAAWNDKLSKFSSKSKSDGGKKRCDYGRPSRDLAHSILVGLVLLHLYLESFVNVS